MFEYWLQVSNFPMKFSWLKDNPKILQSKFLINQIFDASAIKLSKFAKMSLIVGLQLADVTNLLFSPRF